MTDYRIPDWDDAACAQGWHNDEPIDVNIWFDANYQADYKAIAICDECPIKALCLDYAVNTGQEFGIWGGLTPADRKFFRKKKTQSRKGIPNKKRLFL